MFGSNNCIEHPKDIRISLTKRVKELNFNTKYIFQTKNVYSGALQVHSLKYGYTNKIDLSEIFRLNHYPIQSKDFFEKVKMTRGDVNAALLLVGMITVLGTTIYGIYWMIT